MHNWLCLPLAGATLRVCPGKPQLLLCWVVCKCRLFISRYRQSGNQRTTGMFCRRAIPSADTLPAASWGPLTGFSPLYAVSFANWQGRYGIEPTTIGFGDRFANLGTFALMLPLLTSATPFAACTSDFTGFGDILWNRTTPFQRKQIYSLPAFPATCQMPCKAVLQILGRLLISPAVGSCCRWCAIKVSNLDLPGYEPDALPIELMALMRPGCITTGL